MKLILKSMKRISREGGLLITNQNFKKLLDHLIIIFLVKFKVDLVSKLIKLLIIKFKLIEINIIPMYKNIQMNKIKLNKLKEIKEEILDQ